MSRFLEADPNFLESLFVRELLLDVGLHFDLSLGRPVWNDPELGLVIADLDSSILFLERKKMNDRLDPEIQEQLNFCT